ncbi:MAG TPA: 23S rRNA (guanosine(2251)-2'-O)-methyltransferase RlmB [Taishania sp.]|nr:23S rRNA (guanosine(2251)-2'-O)-methyltransferase RlmB [Taishania sp.]
MREKNRAFSRDNNRDNTQKYTRKEDKDIIFGVRAVIEAIKAEREINKILIQKGINKDLFFELKEALKGKDLNLQYVPSQKLDSLTQNNHQGVIAYVSPVEYGNIEELVDKLLTEGKKVNILVLDRITDVRNFGGIARTAECQGVDAILIPSKGSALVTSDAIKTSAGALNRIKVCKTDDLKNSLFYLQQSGIRIIACTEKAKSNLYETNLRGSVAIIMGNEESGITKDLINMSDIATKIPMRGEIQSLNVGVAAGMVLYEKTRQELYGS